MQVLLHKAQAKAQLQATYGLTVSEQYSLAVFVGRVTHQKGVDIIAEVGG
jgi:glycogen synthase